MTNYIIKKDAVSQKLGEVYGTKTKSIQWPKIENFTYRPTASNFHLINTEVRDMLIFETNN